MHFNHKEKVFALHCIVYCHAEMFAVDLSLIGFLDFSCFELVFEITGFGMKMVLIK